MIDRWLQPVLLFTFIAFVICWIFAVIHMVEGENALKEIQWETLVAGILGLVGGSLAYYAARLPHLQNIEKNTIDYIGKHYEEIQRDTNFIQYYKKIVAYHNQDDDAFNENRYTSEDYDKLYLAVGDFISGIEDFCINVDVIDVNLRTAILKIHKKVMKIKASVLAAEDNADINVVPTFFDVLSIIKNETPNPIKNNQARDINKFMDEISPLLHELRINCNAFYPGH
ncbi:hypothetical protein [Kiloniella sp. EL199]|uniref:hypothetical protein n=1 Tax=Kiloniella sp. EL199 TaxID=2107581 RepID=UPI000EA40396|nr:hypothetical protein [Kiloniella sp. EL199]